MLEEIRLQRSGREEGRETSTDSVLINRDGFTRSHSGVVSGGHQSENRGFVS